MDTRFGTQFIPSDTYYIPDSYAYPYDAFKVPVSHPIQRIRLAYNKTGPKYPPSPSGPYLPSKGTVLLLHGFPQTCYQYRHVWTPLAEAGYCVIAPDYRGAGYSEKPLPSEHAFTKKNMASDMLYLLEDKLGVIERDQQGRAGLTEKLHVVGHDIGGMVRLSPRLYPQAIPSVTVLTFGCQDRIRPRHPLPYPPHNPHLRRMPSPRHRHLPLQPPPVTRPLEPPGSVRPMALHIPRRPQPPGDPC